MEEKKLTIDDLLNALSNDEPKDVKLENSKETWERIGNRDTFDELGISESELDDFLKEWIEENPYSAL